MKLQISKIFTYMVSIGIGVLLLSTITTAQLGQIGSNIAGSLSVLKYAIYIIPIAIVGVFVFIFWQRGKRSTKGSNLAMIFSLEHSAISDIKPFVIIRRYDEVKNVEATIAIFPNDLKQQKNGGGGIVGFFRGLLGAGGKKDLTDEEGVPFSEALAVLNQKTGTWFAVFSLSTNMQLPVVSPGSAEDRIYSELDRHVEKRVSQMKKSQLEDISTINPTNMLDNFGKMQIICCVLLFVAISILAFSIWNTGNAVTTINKTITLLHLAANASKT